MKFKIEIPNHKIINFSSTAKSELEKQSARIITDIADEANRIETSRRSRGTRSEVTQSDVKLAASQPNIIYTKKNNFHYYIIQIINSFFTTIMGSLLDVDKFINETHVIYFIFSTIVAIGTTVYLTFNHNHNGLI